MGNGGKPIPGVEVNIHAPDAQGVREVVARGPNVMAGYTDDPEATAKALDASGWLHTGDLGRMDKHGRLTIVGRDKDVVVSASGENVYPDDVERTLGDVTGITEIAVVGIPDPQGGERVALLAVLEGGEVDEAPAARARRRDQAIKNLRAACAKLPSSQQPAVVMPWDAPLPKTSTRKVKRAEVRAVLERLVAATVPVVVREGLGAESPVRNAIAALAKRPAAEITAATRLKADLGFDSLMAMMELAVALEAAVGARGRP